MVPILEALLKMGKPTTDIEIKEKLGRAVSPPGIIPSTPPIPELELGVPSTEGVLSHDLVQATGFQHPEVCYTVFCAAIEVVDGITRAIHRHPFHGYYMGGLKTKAEKAQCPVKGCTCVGLEKSYVTRIQFGSGNMRLKLAIDDYTMENHLTPTGAVQVLLASSPEIVRRLKLTQPKKRGAKRVEGTVVVDGASISVIYR